MTLNRIKALLALLMMVAAFGLGHGVRPENHLADTQEKVDLARMFPTDFGDWMVDTRQPVQLVAPDVQALLDTIYNQVLTRTYVNRVNGARIMLSVAYGGDQSDGTRAHRPEVCYPAQGFEITANRLASLPTATHAVRVRQLVARLGGRVEPISYWVTVGNRIALSGTEQKLAQIRYAFQGVIADGMLVRVSNIDNDVARSYLVHQQFVDAMTRAMAPPVLARVIGAADG